MCLKKCCTSNLAVHSSSVVSCRPKKLPVTSAKSSCKCKRRLHTHTLSYFSRVHHTQPNSVWGQAMLMNNFQLDSRCLTCAKTFLHPDRRVEMACLLLSNSQEITTACLLSRCAGLMLFRWLLWYTSVTYKDDPDHQSPNGATVKAWQTCCTGSHNHPRKCKSSKGGDMHHINASATGVCM